jgi:hypothetical protein
VIAAFVYDAQCEVEALRHGRPEIVTQATQVWNGATGRMVTRNLPTDDNAARGRRLIAVVEAMRAVQETRGDDPPTIEPIAVLRCQLGIRAWDPNDPKRLAQETRQ